MLYSEIIAVCSQIDKKHVNTLCGQNLMLHPGVRIVISKQVHFQKLRRIQR
jgi:hypothetical protein